MRLPILKTAEFLLQAEANSGARVALVAMALLLTGAAATLRISLEAHLAFSLVLLLPTMLIAWYLSAAWAMLTVALVVLTWLAADMVALPVSVPNWVVTVNAMVRAVVFALVAMLTGALRSAYRRQQLLAIRDPLTGLANRRHFMAIAEAEHRRARRYHQQITIGYLDLDGFKAINDTYGHEAGDRVLRIVGLCLLQRLRSVDTAARLGGDEFVVLLPQTGSQPGLKAMSQVQESIAQELKGQGFDAGVSAGVATFVEAPGSVHEMLDAADKLMYEAKRAYRGALRHAVVDSANDGPPDLARSRAA